VISDIAAVLGVSLPIFIHPPSMPDSWKSVSLALAISDNLSLRSETDIMVGDSVCLRNSAILTNTLLFLANLQALPSIIAGAKLVEYPAFI
jgi:hypothetical protein